MMDDLYNQLNLIAAGIFCYLLALFVPAFYRKPVVTGWNLSMMFQMAGIGFFLAAIVVRWKLAGHGPFIAMFEILLSSTFSLGFVLIVASVYSAAIRKASLTAIVVILVLGFWLLVTRNTIGPLPPTYDNNWLWVHVAVGKIFLGLNLVATSLAAYGLWLSRGGGSQLTQAQRRDIVRLAWAYFLASFVFHSLMLIAGAVWAQDAWGRYWAWDPLETWAFVTWLAMVLLIHVRSAYRFREFWVWIGMLLVFVLAFFTFFGAPFISIAPHKGAV